MKWAVTENPLKWGVHLVVELKIQLITFYIDCHFFKATSFFLPCAANQLLFSPFLEKAVSKERLCSEAPQLCCEMNSICTGFDVPLNICLSLCFHYSCRQKSAVTNMRNREREWQSITGYIACCVVWKIFQRAAIEVTVENELSAVILFIQHVSLPEAVYFKAFKTLWTKGVFPVAAWLCTMDESI